LYFIWHVNSTNFLKQRNSGKIINKPDFQYIKTIIIVNFHFCNINHDSYKYIFVYTRNWRIITGTTKNISGYLQGTINIDRKWNICIWKIATTEVYFVLSCQWKTDVIKFPILSWYAMTLTHIYIYISIAG